MDADRRPHRGRPATQRVDDAAQRHQRTHRGLIAIGGRDEADRTPIEIWAFVLRQIFEIIEGVLDQARNRAVIPGRGDDHAMDGLLDRVYDDLDKVALNNGRGFDGLRELSIDPTSINQSTVAPPSLSAALHDAVQGLSYRISNDAESFTAGIGVNTSGSRAKSVGIDLNGDGLVDIIDDEGQKIYINTGTTYSIWKDSSNQNIDLSAPTELAQSQNFGITGDVGGTLLVKRILG